MYRRNVLNEFIRNAIKDKAKVKEVRDALDRDDIEKAKSLKEEVDEMKAEIDELADKVEKIEEENKEDEQEDEGNQISNGEGEQRMAQPFIPEPTNEETRAFQSYLETREIDGGALKTDSGFVVVPEEVVNEI